tara:strand:- start:97 stop:534 length:438 start_codon:yes stop_codon:yes gene_type:complete
MAKPIKNDNRATKRRKKRISLMSFTELQKEKTRIEESINSGFKRERKSKTRLEGFRKALREYGVKLRKIKKALKNKTEQTSIVGIATINSQSSEHEVWPEEQQSTSTESSVLDSNVPQDTGTLSKVSETAISPSLQEMPARERVS